MDFNNISLFSVMKAKLKYMSERQAVLAQNVANADTPGYKSQDIKAPDFQDMVSAQSLHQRLQMTTTNPLDISKPAGQSNDRFTAQNSKDTYELNPDGNNVAIEDEMVKLSDNQQEYQKVINLYSKMISMFNTAIDKQAGS